MTPSNSMCEVPNYGSSASYCDLPSPEQIRAGVVPLDSLPAAWWNAMWACTNGEVNKARNMLGQLITELNNVLSNAGVCACSSCTDQLYQSIDKIRQTLANATVAGAVKSSSQPSEVAVNEQGYMTVNCLGNAASLTTSASTVVGAINELKSTYDCCVSDINTAIGNKAPTSHASTATTYGVGNASNYGHLKISDTYTSVLSACSGVAASQKAVACVYCYAAGVAAGVAALGNTNGCALGTAAAGTATTAARSDHVHPLPATVCCAKCVSRTAVTTGTCDVVLTAANTTADGQALAVSGTCRLRFNAANGTLTAATFSGALSGNATSANKALCLCNRPASGTASVACNVTFLTGCTNAECTATNRAACICGANGYFYGLAGAYLPVIRAADPGSTASKVCSVVINAYCTNASCTKTTRTFTFCGSTGYIHGNVCGNVCGIAACAWAYGDGTAFGTAATCAATAFRSCTWWPDDLYCGKVAVAYISCFADRAALGYTWNGRSACNTNCFCVCYDATSNNGTLCCWCNKTTDHLMIVGAINGCGGNISIIIPPASRASYTLSSMSCGTSYVRVILL